MADRKIAAELTEIRGKNTTTVFLLFKKSIHDFLIVIIWVLSIPLYMTFIVKKFYLGWFQG